MIKILLLAMMLTACGTMEGDVNVEPPTSTNDDKSKVNNQETEDTKGNETSQQPLDKDISSEDGYNKDTEDFEAKNINVDVDVNVNVDVNGDNQQRSSTNLLKMGLTKKQVFNIFGNPVEVENLTYPYDDGTIWIWEDKDYCVRNYPYKVKCTVEFDEKGEVIDWDDIKGDFIDLLD